MANPYHDETGRFCSKEEMGQAVDRLAQEGRLEEALTLSKEYNVAFEAETKASMESFINGAMEKFMANRDYMDEKGVNPQEFASLSEGDSQFGNFVFDADESAGRWRDFEPPVEYDYDTVDQSSDNYYGSYTKVVGGKVTMPVDLSALANFLYAPKTDSARRAAVAFLKTEGFNSSDAFEIGGRSNYYGEDAYIALTENAREKAEQFFRQFPNAADGLGLYDRARAEGVDVSGKTPEAAFLAGLQAKYGKKLPLPLRKQLDLEATGNSWRKLSIKLESHSPKVIEVDEKVLAKATAVENVPAKKEVAGILLAVEGNTSNFKLIEGVENVKALRALTTSAATKQRKYITVVLPKGSKL